MPPQELFPRVARETSTAPRYPLWLRAYAQLVRLPNIFTAMADIALGWMVSLATGTPTAHWPSCALLLCSSCCLYAAGMVWNDFFDIEQDRRERPFRPLPSGRIARRSAARLGFVLLVLGLTFAGLAGKTTAAQGTPFFIAAILAGTILLYDRWLKRTWAGPLAMGGCRFLNVLLGLSLADEVGLPWGVRVYFAAIVGLYIVGVTWFARTEARVSSQSALTAASVVLFSSLVGALGLPTCFESGTSSWLFPYLLVILGFLVGVPISLAIAQPTPVHVQTAVKRALVGLVVLDAVLATAVAGVEGLVILLLLVPTLYLGRWIYST